MKEKDFTFNKDNTEQIASDNDNNKQIEIYDIGLNNREMLAVCSKQVAKIFAYKLLTNPEYLNQDHIDDNSEGAKCMILFWKNIYKLSSKIESDQENITLKGRVGDFLQACGVDVNKDSNKYVELIGVLGKSKLPKEKLPLLGSLTLQASSFFANNINDYDMMIDPDLIDEFACNINSIIKGTSKKNNKETELLH